MANFAVGNTTSTSATVTNYPYDNSFVYPYETTYYPTPPTYVYPQMYYNWSYQMTEQDVDRVADRVIEKLKLELLDYIDPVVLLDVFVSALKDSAPKR